MSRGFSLSPEDMRTLNTAIKNLGEKMNDASLKIRSINEDLRSHMDGTARATEIRAILDAEVKIYAERSKTMAELAKTTQNSLDQLAAVSGATGKASAISSDLKDNISKSMAAFDKIK